MVIKGLHITLVHTSPGSLCRAEDNTCSALCPLQFDSCRGKGQMWTEQCWRERVSSTRTKGSLTHLPSNSFSKEISVLVYSSLFGTMAKTCNTVAWNPFRNEIIQVLQLLKPSFTGRKPVKQLQLSSCLCCLSDIPRIQIFLSVIHCLLLSGYYDYINKCHAFGHVLSFQRQHCLRIWSVAWQARDKR